jgi:outer membrane receptor protein involved in Fe transport
LILEQQLTYLPLPELEIVGGINITYSGNLPKTNDLAEPFNLDEYRMFSTEKISDTLFGEFGYNPVTFYNLGGFLQAYYKKGKFILLAGYRYDYHSRYKGAGSPRAAIQFQARTNVFLRGSVGWGFRAPSAYYTYSSLAWPDEGGVYYSGIPNESLKPEKIISAEIGTRWKYDKYLSLDVSMFYHRLKNQFTRSFVLIDKNKYPQATNVEFTSSYVNDDTSRAELYGIQIALSAHDLINAVKLGGDLRLSLSKGNEILAYPRGTIDSYRQWPVFLGQLDISLRPVRVLLLYLRNNVSTRWTKQYLPLDKSFLEELGYETTTKGFYTLDLLARLYINRHFQAFFQLNNVFNANYAGIDAYGSETDLRYNPQYGRNFRLGLSFFLE